MTLRANAAEELEHVLFKERSLWSVGLKALRLKASKHNVFVAAAFTFGTFAVSICNGNAAELTNQLHGLALIVLGATISLLGFLIAGFSFFATVSDKAMFCEMALLRHKGSGLSYLKYNLFEFMLVFAEYLVVCIVSVGLVIALQPSSAARATIRSWTKDLDWPCRLWPHWPFDCTVLSVGLALYVGAFISC